MTYSSTILADSPIAYWRLGEAAGTDAADELTTSDGVYNNTPTLGAASLIATDAGNTAVTFALASNEYVSVDDNATISAATGTGACSWEFWTKLTTDAYGTWIGKFNNLQISHAITTGLIMVSDYVLGAACHSSAGFTDTTTAHHVVVTKDGSGNWKVYLDGADVTVTDAARQLTDNGSAITIGRGEDQGPINATMDEVAAYDYVLSAGQVEAHHSAALTSDAGGGSATNESLVNLDILRSLAGL